MVFLFTFRDPVFSNFARTVMSVIRRRERWKNLLKKSSRREGILTKFLQCWLKAINYYPSDDSFSFHFPPLLMRAEINCSIFFREKRGTMKIRTNNFNTIEQKKTLGKKLRLSKETIRELKDSDLKVVAGGVPTLSNNCQTSGGC